MSRTPFPLLPVLAALHMLFAPAAQAQEGRADAVLIQGEEQLRLSIWTGVIGLLLAERFEGEREEALRALAERGLRPVDEGRDRLVIVEAPGDGPPAELLAQAVMLRDENPELIAQAGYVAEFVETNDPMLVTDQLVVQFDEGVEPGRAEEIAAEAELKLLFENPYMKGEYLAAVPAAEGVDTLEVSNRLNEFDEVDYAHPNLIRRKVARQALVPNDTFFGNQWHHLNTGQSGGLVDADVDSDRAWGLALGDAGTIIAVIDGGFDMGHPDLTPNYWANPGETANGADDDGNGQTDDLQGWDFTGCDAAVPGPGCGDNNPTGPDTAFGRHGTSVAGAAAGRGNNALGVSGTCPNCTIMPIRISGFSGSFSDGLAFGYARVNGADVITNSWGYALNAPATNNVLNAINAAANNGRGGLGSVVLFAMNTTGGGWFEDCAAPGVDISSPATVIAVGASSNTDQRTPSGYGDCMDLLGPTDSIGAAGGTLWAVTTDMRGNAGYNNNAGSAVCPSAEPAPPPNSDRDYTFCFGGTSFATPVTAGIAGLVLSERPGLTRLQVQRILQDTADKIDPAIAAYGDDTGFSDPTPPPQMGFPVGSTHGYGRVNAFEAVRLATAAEGGRDGTDIVIRDNRLDWGNTEQPSNVLMDAPRGFIPHYRSVDIKVDAPPFEPVAPATSAAFDAFTHQEPESGVVNRVYVRVRNRGPVAATDVTAKLHWAFAGAGLPALPSDFWTAFPADSADTSIWHPVGVANLGTVGYSGSSVAGTAADAAQIAVFDFSAPEFDPSLPNPDHYCLFVVIDSNEDPVSAASMASLVPDVITPRDNNVTHRNVSLQDSGRDGRFSARFLINNPFENVIETLIRVHAPEGWKLESQTVPLDREFRMEPGQQELVELFVQVPDPGTGGTVAAQQILLGPNVETPEVLGGIDFEVAARRLQIPRLEIDMLSIIRDQQRQLDKLLLMMGEGGSPRGPDPVLETIREVSRAMQSQNRLLLLPEER